MCADLARLNGKSRKPAMYLSFFLSVVEFRLGYARHPSYPHSVHAAEQRQETLLIKMGDRTVATDHALNQQMAVCSSPAAQYQTHQHCKCNESAF